MRMRIRTDMSLLTQSWLWVSLLSGFVGIAFFFVALHVDRSKQRFYESAARGTVGQGPPQSNSETAAFYLHKKRPFRDVYFFYSLARAYVLYM